MLSMPSSDAISLAMFTSDSISEDNFFAIARKSFLSDIILPNTLLGLPFPLYSNAF